MAAPRGLALRQTLRSEGTTILCLSWSPNGRTLAAGTTDGVALWDVGRGKLRRSFSTKPVLDLDWSRDGKLLATTSGNRVIQIWEPWTAVKRHTLRGHAERVNALAWSKTDLHLASASDDHTVKIWDGDSGSALHTLHGHEKAVLAVCWAPGGSEIASISIDGSSLRWSFRGSAGEAARLDSGGVPLNYPALDVAWAPRGGRIAAALAVGTVLTWDAESLEARELLGHSAEVGALAFSSDGRLLASKSADRTVRLWSTSSWESLAVLESGSDATRRTLAFHPGEPTLAVLGKGGASVDLWAIDAAALGKRERSSTVHYSNAKVVLVGDSGVGKSGLALVMSGQPFAATESTHGRRVFPLRIEPEKTGDGGKEIREILLWDLAGQPGYRLIHQLHLDEVAVALVVFDARSETDPFAGVGHWSRALRDAQRLQPEHLPTMKKFLVAARVDRGGIAASRARIAELCAEAGFDGYFETSAREGRGVAELTSAVLGGIDWARQPRVSSDALFQRIKDFLVEEKTAGRVLSSADDLYHSLLRAPNAPPGADELRAQFDTCVGRVEARGLLRRLSFGGLVLLQPELIDAYASALIDAARDEPGGLGSIEEERVRAASFPIPEGERLSRRDPERLLLIAMVEDLLRHEIALREDGRLIFPSQLTRENPDLPSPQGQAVVFGFEGPTQSVYSTLAVRLAHSGEFARRAMWKNAAAYTATAGGDCGVYLRVIDEGRAELTLFFDGKASEQTRFSFEHFVRAHLERRALPGSLTRRRLHRCGKCDSALTDEQVQKRRQGGHHTLRCPVCDASISLLDGAERLARAQRITLVEMDRAADARRDREAAVTVVDGKREAREFDVFLAHNAADKRAIEKIALALRARGLNPWLDKEQIAPGRWFQDVIQQAIGEVKSAAIFVGQKGIGRWETLELRAFITACIESGRHVIPVLLPGVSSLPAELPFLRELNAVRFESLDDDAALQQSIGQLAWGITGRKPHPTLR